jgi:hypothetical protein
MATTRLTLLLIAFGGAGAGLMLAWSFVWPLWDWHGASNADAIAGLVGGAVIGCTLALAGAMVCNTLLRLHAGRGI